MQENREISWTSWSNDQDRSAKAINRKADTNVQEKSDCAVIPVNQPNKGRELAAEAGKGRAQTQENIVQSHIRPTQSGKRMSQRLHGVRQAARGRKQERFTALLHHLSVGLLRASFYALKRQVSPGIDGVKADGRQRPLGIAALEDKIVQQAVVTILNQIYEVDFKGFSCGFRPGRGPHQALDALAAGIQWKRVNWVLDGDQRWSSLPRQCLPVPTWTISALSEPVSLVGLVMNPCIIGAFTEAQDHGKST
jgi:hypothetical protein